MIVNGERELAYTAEIIDVKKHPNADRLDIVVVNGWNVISGRDEFKKGEIAVFFEIDSKLPEVKPFTDMEFLASKHYKISSQRIRGVISQGFVVPISDLAKYFNIKENIKVDEPLTKVLGVTYAVAEDNVRKGNGKNKNARYTSMSARHKNLFSKNPFRWLMRREWGRRLLFVFFGKKKDTPLGFPTKFEFVHKTDEERCLWKDTKVLTDRGLIRIADIVNKKLNINVLSKSENGLEYKPISSYQKYPIEKELIKFIIPYRFNVKRNNSLICTKDHKLLTDKGYKQAKDISLDDNLYIISNTYPKECVEYLKECKLYKTKFKVENILLPIKIKDISIIYPKHSNYVYDIEVKDNHNFIASGVVNHNCENMPWILKNKDPWIKTTKIDGTSATYILERKKFGKYEFYVTSRNVRQRTPDQKNYHDTDTNVYWDMVFKYHIYDFLRKMLDQHKSWKYVCLQGEIAGPNIQGNPHKFNDVRFFGFNFIDSENGRWNSVDAKNTCGYYGIPWVPIVDTNYILPDDFEEFKLSADGECEAPGASGLREGYVYRSQDGKQSFKNVSREYLISRGL